MRLYYNDGPKEKLYTSQSQRSRRGQWGTIPRFSRSVSPIAGNGSIFPFTRTINPCSEMSVGIDPYQVSGHVRVGGNSLLPPARMMKEEPLNPGWTHSANFVSMDSPKHKLPMYPGDPATNIVTEEFARDKFGERCGRNTVATMGDHMFRNQFGPDSTVPDPYGAQRKYRSQTFPESAWNMHPNMHPRALSVSACQRANKQPRHCRSMSQARGVKGGTPRGAGGSGLPRGALATMGAWAPTPSSVVVNTMMARSITGSALSPARSV